MKIEKDLRLVIPFETANGESFVHAQAISRAVFERYYSIIAKTLTTIYGDGLGVVAGPRVAALRLREIAKNVGVEDDVQIGLFNEIHRLANVALLTAKGWEHVPFAEAMAKKMIDEDEASEIENALVFFTLVWSIEKASERPKTMRGAARLWRAQLTSLDFTAFVASLPISTATVNSGETIQASSVIC